MGGEVGGGVGLGAGERGGGGVGHGGGVEGGGRGGGGAEDLVLGGEAGEFAFEALVVG